LQKHDEAERALPGAPEFSPQYASPWHNLGTVLHEQKREEALKAYRRA